MTAHILHLPPQTVCADPGLPSLIAHLHTIGDITDADAAVYQAALIGPTADAPAARAAALLALSADADLRVGHDGLRLLAELAGRAATLLGWPEATQWQDLCDKADEARALIEDSGAVDAYLDSEAPVWGRAGLAAELAGHIDAERAMIAGWLAGGAR